MQRSLICLFSIGFVQMGSGHLPFPWCPSAGPSIPSAPVGSGAVPASSPRWPRSGIPVALPGLAREGCVTSSPAFLAVVPSRWILSSGKRTAAVGHRGWEGQRSLQPGKPELGNCKPVFPPGNAPRTSPPFLAPGLL